MKALDTRLYVSGQIQPADVKALSARGITDIICNRPDGEAYSQPDFSTIAAAAQNTGVLCHYQPIGLNGITLPDIEAFRTVYKKADGKILAYCTSGTRCCALWLLARSRDVHPDILLPMAQKQGYDLRQLTPMMTAIHSDQQS